MLLAALVAALVAFVATRQRAGQSGAAGARPILSQVPADAFLVAEVDVARLRATDLGRRLLGRGRNIAGLGDIVQVCGSDPMEVVDHVAVAVPGDDEVGFGLFADGPLVARDIIGCAERIVTQRGGRAVRQSKGRFLVLKDASAALSSAHLAVADGGPLILGEPAYVDASLGLDPAQSLARDATHRGLRDALEGDVVKATAVLSIEQRKMLREELVAQRTPDSPFVAVRAGGLAIGLTRELALHAILQCDDAPACAAVAALVDDARREEAKSAASLLSGLGELLARLHVRADGPTVHLRLKVDVDEALALVARILALRRLAQAPGQPQIVPAPAAVAPVAPTASAAVSSERIEPAPD
jgi:hypothetical protein